MYGLIGSFKCVAGKRSEVARLMLADTGIPAGCLSFVVAEDPVDADLLWMTEVWVDAAAHKASLEIPRVKAVIAQAMPLIVSFGMHQETRPLGGIHVGD